MLESPRITSVAARPAAVIHLVIPRSRIREVMGPAFGELHAALAAQGVAPAGPLFTHHLRVDAETFDFEAGLPVAAPIAPMGRVVPGGLPAATAAVADYCGPYEGLPAAWGEFNAWLAAEGRTPGPTLWESYLAGPESGPDPATWRTELVRPLADPA